jgi:chromosome segregation ATPase
MRPKGMREIKTARGIAGRAGASSHEQARTELTWLEHERARLQRELEVWRQNGQRVEGQLQRVEARLAELRTLTAEGAPPPRPAQPSRRPERDEPAPGWSLFTLEY